MKRLKNEWSRKMTVIDQAKINHHLNRFVGETLSSSFNLSTFSTGDTTIFILITG